jgi:hypothetical protein
MVSSPPTADVPVASGEFFFGHFTEPQRSVLAASQEPSEDALMIEAIAWDPDKKVFNFYELIGNGSGSDWAYRGDSVDIAKAVARLHRKTETGQPKFPEAVLRCAGCHVAGGPIMKELAPPHNDWWTTERKLPLKPFTPSAQLAPILSRLVSAEELSSAVKAGIEKLAASESIRKLREERSLQERLRPLFCPVELNLESDSSPSPDGSSPLAGAAAEVSVPTGFFVDPVVIG